MSSNSKLPSLKQQRNFWDWHWQNSKERKTINAWKAERHDAMLTVLRSLPLPTHPEILDLGCGHGWFAEKLADLGHISGIDLSEEGIRIAKLRVPTANLVAGNLYEFPLPNDYYDVVVSQEVIDHVEDQLAFIDRAAELLKPGGHFVVSCANKFVMDRLGSAEFPEERPEHIEEYLSLDDLKRLLSRRFKILQARTILPVAGRRGILRVVHSHKLNAALEHLLSRERIKRLKERARFGYQLLAVAQRL